MHAAKPVRVVARLPRRAVKYAGVFDSSDSGAQTWQQDGCTLFGANQLGRTITRDLSLHWIRENIVADAISFDV